MKTRRTQGRINASGLSRGSLSRGFRWLLVSIFPLGVLSTHARWGASFGPALLVSLIGSLCFGLFLVHVRELTARTLMPILVAAVLLIAYPLKVYFLAAVSWDSTGLGPLDYIRIYVSMLSVEALYEAYATGMTGVSAFFLACFVLLPLTNRHPRTIDWTPRVNRRVLMRLLWILLAASALLGTAISLIALHLGVLRFGVEARTLPFRLTGVLNVSRTFFGSLLPLVILYFALSVRSKRLAWASILVLFVNSMLFAVVSGSRGVAILWIAGPVFMLIVTRQLRLSAILRARWAIPLGAALCILAIVFSVITEFRAAATERGLGTIAALSSGVESTIDVTAENPLIALVTTGGVVLARFIGSEQLIVVQEMLGRPRPQEAWHALVERNRPTGVYYTREVLGIDTYDYQVSPGLIGFLWQCGGTPVVITGMILFTFLMFFMNGIYGLTLRLMVAPVTLASFAQTAAIFASEGTFKEVFGPEPLFISLALVIGAEMTARCLVAWSRRGKPGRLGVPGTPSASCPKG